jgi:hypothetical protein
MQCEVCGETPTIGVTLVPQRNIFGVSPVYRCLKHHVPEMTIKPKIYPMVEPASNSSSENLQLTTTMTNESVSPSSVDTAFNDYQRIRDAINIVASLAQTPDRSRAYSDQPDDRDRLLIFGLTMRDLMDCMAMGILAAQVEPAPDIVAECWLPAGLDGVPKPSPFLLSELTRMDHASCFLPYKVRLNLWTYMDLYKIGEFDPQLAIRNASDFIYGMMKPPAAVAQLPSIDVAAVNDAMTDMSIQDFTHGLAPQAVLDSMSAVPIQDEVLSANEDS